MNHTQTQAGAGPPVMIPLPVYGGGQTPWSDPKHPENGYWAEYRRQHKRRRAIGVVCYVAIVVVVIVSLSVYYWGMFSR